MYIYEWDEIELPREEETIVYFLTLYRSYPEDNTEEEVFMDYVTADFIEQIEDNSFLLPVRMKIEPFVTNAPYYYTEDGAAFHAIIIAGLW